MMAFILWIYIRNRAPDLVPGLNLPQINREITWSLVFPLLSLAGISLALADIPWSAGIYVIAPCIMVILYWKTLA
jgi:hypothetical protein